MIKEITRLYHCHKIHRNVNITEYYEVVEDNQTLLRCSCPYHLYKDMKPHCDGYNDFGFQCGYAKSQ